MLANETYMGYGIEAGGVLKEAFGQVKALVLSETSLTIICPPLQATQGLLSSVLAAAGVLAPISLKVPCHFG